MAGHEEPKKKLTSAEMAEKLEMSPDVFDAKIRDASQPQVAVVPDEPEQDSWQVQCKLCGRVAGGLPRAQSRPVAETHSWEQHGGDANVFVLGNLF